MPFALSFLRSFSLGAQKTLVVTSNCASPDSELESHTRRSAC